MRLINMKQITVYIADTHAKWLDAQPRSFKLSPLVRKLLDEYITEEEVTQNEHTTNQE